jgi:N-hydroxyarylamine O-acetyltransferase
MTATTTAIDPRLDRAQVTGYLRRIGVDGPVTPTADWLERLHLAHLRTVPFENLDLHLDRPIDLDVGALYDKVVGRRRGGFCYELNALFRALLTSVGFDVTLVSSRVWMPDGTLSPPFDHATLLVDLDGPWLADVGFGEAFSIPRPLGDEWVEPEGRARTSATPDGWRVEVDEGQGWRPLYDLDPAPRRLEEFAARCRWHQTDPDSFFRQVPFVSQATPTGRVTVMGDVLIVTDRGTRTDRALDELGGVTRAARGRFDPAVVEQLEQVYAKTS